MAAFTTLAIAGALGAAGVFAAKKATSKNGEEGNVANRRGRTNTNPAPTTGQIGTGGDAGGRRRPPDAPVIGTAVPRNPAPGDTSSTSATNVPTPPSNDTAAGQAAGQAAAMRAKKAGAGASVLTGLPVNKGASGARLRPKSLIGY